jgi:hypothetical protein
MEFIMRTNTVAGVIFGLLMVLAIPSQAQEHEDIDCSGLDASEDVKDLCEDMWDEEEIRQMIRDEIDKHIGKDLVDGIRECFQHGTCSTRLQ